MRHSAISISGSSSSSQSSPSRSAAGADTEGLAETSAITGDGDGSEGSWEGCSTGSTGAGRTRRSTNSTKWSLIGIIKTLTKQNKIIENAKLKDGRGDPEKTRENLTENWKAKREKITKLRLKVELKFLNELLRRWIKKSGNGRVLLYALLSRLLDSTLSKHVRVVITHSHPFLFGLTNLLYQFIVCIVGLQTITCFWFAFRQKLLNWFLIYEL